MTSKSKTIAQEIYDETYCCMLPPSTKLAANIFVSFFVAAAILVLTVGAIFASKGLWLGLPGAILFYVCAAREFVSGCVVVFMKRIERKENYKTIGETE